MIFHWLLILFSAKPTGTALFYHFCFIFWSDQNIGWGHFWNNLKIFTWINYGKFWKNQVLKLLIQFEPRRISSEVSGLRSVNYFNRKRFSLIFWDLPRDLCVYLRLETWTHLWKCRTRKPKEEVKTPKSSQTYKNFTSHFKPKTDACLKLAWIRNISTFKF